MRRRSVKEILGAPTSAADQPGLTYDGLAQVAAPLVGVPAGLISTAFKAAVSFSTATGVKAKSGAIASFHAPYDGVVIAIAAALLNRGRGIRTVFDTSAGCFFEAVLPMSLLTHEGTIMIQVVDASGEVQVTGSTEVKGQLYDWGRGKREIRAVLKSVRAYIGLMGQ